MPVPLPPAPGGQVVLPLETNDPPTLQDVTRAIRYHRLVDTSNRTRRNGEATDNDLAEAAIYEAKVIAAHAGEPAWFAPAIAGALDSALPAALDNALPPILPAMVENAVNQAIAPIRKVAARSYNMQCGNGVAFRFEIVPFVDGSLPSQPPHNLPALHNLQAIRALTNPNVNAYMAGYGLDPTHLIVDRKRAIAREIGCTAPVAP